MKKRRLFDIQSPQKGKALPQFSAWAELRPFFLFLVLAFLLFSALSLYENGTRLFRQGQQAALTGYDSLHGALQSLEKKEVNEAERWLENAQKSFDELSRNTALITAQANDFSGKSLYLESVSILTESAVEMTALGREFLALLSQVRGWPAQLEGQAGPGHMLVGLIKEKKTEFDRLVQRVVALQNKLSEVNTTFLPLELKEKIQTGQGQMGQLLAALHEGEKALEAGLRLLGSPAPHRFLILLQNHNERRPTGGFIGSLVLADVSEGRLIKLEPKDVYEVDGQLTQKVPAPPGIDRVADGWYLRDANTSPDFPISAQKIMWFLEHSRGPSVDTVIAIDQTLVEGLLDLTGPVFLDEIPFQISAGNFDALFSYFVEAKLGEGPSPKSMMFGLIPVLQEKLLTLGDWPGLLSLLSEGVQQKHLQAYSRSADVQSLIRRLYADGALPKPLPETDFLSVISTSIGGNKSDAYIKTQLAHRSEIQVGGGITDHLYIQKTHTWEEGEFERRWGRFATYYGGEKLSEETLRFILGEGENKDYMRVYAPRGAELITSEGLARENITAKEEGDYTVFSFDFPPVSAGESRALTLHYQLPFTLATATPATYRFIAASQAGAENITLKKNLTLPQGWQITEMYPPTKAFSLNPSMEGPFEENQIFMAEFMSP